MPKHNNVDAFHDIIYRLASYKRDKMYITYISEVINKIIYITYVEVTNGSLETTFINKVKAIIEL